MTTTTGSTSGTAPGSAPETDDRDPAGIVADMVDHVLALAGTWTAWDGRPVPADDRVHTPHKAIRRVADHLVDHLAEMEARLVGRRRSRTTGTPRRPPPGRTSPRSPVPTSTRPAAALTRLARIWVNRLEALTPEQLDRSPGTGWTFRQLAFHVAESTYYADAVGDLAPARTPEHAERTPTP